MLCIVDNQRVSCVSQKRLQSYYLEFKKAFFYALFSWFITFVISYQNCTVLLYWCIYPFTVCLTNLISRCFQDSGVVESNDYGYVLKCDSNQLCLSWDTNFLEKSHLSQSVNNHKIDFSEIPLTDCVNLLNDLSKIDLSAIKFIFTDVEEAFSSQLLVCLVFSFAIMTLYLAYTIICCVRPCFYKHEIAKVLSLSIVYVGLCVFVAINIQLNGIPIFLEFLFQFEIKNQAFSVLSDYKISSYLNWSSKIFVVLNTGIVVLFCVYYSSKRKLQLDKVCISSTIKKIGFVRKSGCVLALIISSIICPPDLFFQLAIYLVLLLVLEFLIWFFLICNRRFLFSKY